MMSSINRKVLRVLGVCSILLTLMYVVLAGNAAYAATGSRDGIPASKAVLVDMSIPECLFLGWAEGSKSMSAKDKFGWLGRPGDCAFWLTVDELVQGCQGGAKALENVGTLKYKTNVPNTELRVSRTDWTPESAGLDGDFILETRDLNGSWVEIPTAGYKSLGMLPTGGSGKFEVDFQLSGYDMEDDSGGYQTIVMWTISS
jgi:hypothetical protein